MKRFILPLIAITALVVASCSTHRKELSYFDDLSEYNSGTLAEGIDAVDTELKLMPGDELLITVNSIDPGATAQYNLPLINPATEQTSPTTSNTQQQQVYRVNALGDINFPTLGKIHIEGMTIPGLTQYLTKRISEDVIDPIVTVTLTNFHITILGEVGGSHSIRANRERFTILDALGQAGDLTSYGRRDNILVIREIDGKKVYARLNLKDSKVMESPFFYLRQNDVVYIEPNEVREDNVRYNTNNAFKLTVISSVISAVSVIASLVIALTR